MRHRPRKPITKIGKETKKWLQYREDWLERNPPPYICGICLQPIIGSVTLDHIIPRSNRPDLRYEDSNIQPAHYFCNNIKGSKHENSY